MNKDVMISFVLSHPATYGVDDIILGLCGMAECDWQIVWLNYRAMEQPMVAVQLAGSQIPAVAAGQ